MSATRAYPRPIVRPLLRPDRHSHEHIWQLPDGTGLHVPFATLAFSADRTLVFCHLCGRGFRHLGAHVRAHGHTAATYRELLGLRARVALAAPDVSAGIAVRQRRRWDRDPTVREHFAAGQQMARDGTLAWLARRSADSPQGTRERREMLAAGRKTQRHRRAQDLDVMVTSAGARDLHDFLRSRYNAGASMATLADVAGLGRERLRSELLAAG